MIPIKPSEILDILAVTDRTGLHREAVIVPLAREDAGALRLRKDGKIEITAPETGEWAAWLSALPEALGRLDLSRLKRVDPEEE